MNDPTNWNPQGEFDSLTFASYTDAKKAEVLFNRLMRECEAWRQQAESYALASKPLPQRESEAK